MLSQKEKRKKTWFLESSQKNREQKSKGKEMIIKLKECVSFITDRAKVNFGTYKIFLSCILFLFERVTILLLGIDEKCLSD